MYMTQGLHRALQQRADAIATVSNGRRRTWRVLAERVARLAGALRALGVAADDRVGMLALNSDRYLEFELATWWAGGAINPVNVRWSPAEIAYSLDDCQTAVLLVDDAHAALVPELRERSRALRTVIHAGDGAEPPAGMPGYEALVAGSDPVPDALRSGADLAAVMYTGGTTGFPKGVMLTHANLFQSVLQTLAEDCVEPGGVGLLSSPMFHVAGLALSNMLLFAGSTLVFLPAFDPLAVLEAIHRERADTTFLAPTMLQRTVDHPQAGEFDLSSLKVLMYGASPISEAVLDRAIHRLSNARFIQAYGMTELSPTATILPGWHHTPEGRRAGKVRSAGRAAFASEVRIVDAADDEVPRGTIGEIAVRSPGIMRGYWNKPAETAAAIRGGWMHTGDAGYMDADGFVFVVDRIKDMIVTGGENVYSVEVENAIATHPAVAICAVIGVPDEQWGERVHAVVTLKPGASLDEADLRAHCKTLIAGYKCPRSAEFIDALPMSGPGKVLKSELRRRYWGGRERNVN
ncbi:MAG: long-chain-fatty-acid--CoA ligase [Gammaproteobacteria bacterium]